MELKSYKKYIETVYQTEQKNKNYYETPWDSGQKQLWFQY